MLHIHVPLFHLLSCNSLLHPQVKLERSRIAPIIPMEYPRRAGKSCPVHRRCSRHRDHPRVGREKQTGTVYAVLPYGSPPRMRGKEQGAGGRMAAHGITPAWAGKSRTRHRPGHRCRDHPRVGGEKFYELEQTAGVTGSPPRGRGKVWLFRCDAL